MLLKTVSEHDVSKNECFKISFGEPYVEFLRPFKMLNLTGIRRLNLELFWGRNSDKNVLALVELFDNGQLASDQHPADISLYTLVTPTNGQNI